TPQEPTCGRSPLHLAVEAQATEVLEILLRAGADPAARMYGGRTPLGSGCARALLQPRPQRPREAPDTYLAESPDHTSNPSHTPVALCSETDLEREEEEESEEDWKLQLEAENYEGHTPLHVAVIHRDSEMVRLLRDAGADLNKLEPTCGRSPLHLAVEAQATEVLEILLRAGADPAARMYGGRTPLGSALLRPNPILARLLRAHGAPEPEDEDDKSSPCSSSSDSDSDSRDEGVSKLALETGRR
uniref:Nuclear factor of kappa light polypeptide gene enhancer in B-cells inhibitor, beta n=1 Tax=Spermophilus dauricus TaxID=99837 RepID=A0A8C9UK50_SPEDA